MRPILAAALFVLTLPHAAADEADDLAGKAAREAKAGRWKEAHDLADQAAKVDPTNPAGPFAAGAVYLAQRRPAEAVTAYTEGLKRDPRGPRPTTAAATPT